MPELPVYASTETDAHEEATAGIVDAIAFDADGAPQVVIDWKSDVDPSPETLDHYRSQVRAYLDMTGAELGLIVAVTSGTIHPVARLGEGQCWASSPMIARRWATCHSSGLRRPIDQYDKAKF